MREIWLENPKKNKRRNRKSARKKYYNRGKSNMAKRRKNPAKRRRRRNPPPLRDSFVDAAYATGGFLGTKYLVPRVMGLLNVQPGGVVGFITEVGTSFMGGTFVERFMGKTAGKMVFIGGLLGTLANFITERGLFGLSGYNIDPNILCAPEYPGISMGQLPAATADVTQEDINEVLPPDQPVMDNYDMPERLKVNRLQ